MVIFRHSNPIANVTPTSSTSVSDKVMEVSEMALSFISPTPVFVKLGDYVTHNGRDFVFPCPPDVSKTHNGEFKYSATIKERHGCELENTLFLFCDQDFAAQKTFYSRGDFPLTGTLSEFLSLLCRNLNRNVSDGDFWVFSIRKGYDQTKTAEQTFSNVSCLSALNQICETFSAEWRINGRKIECGTEIEDKTSLQFSYPLNLASPLRLSYEQTDEFCTRLFVFGGERNVTSTEEASTRLKMAGNKDFIAVKGSSGKPIVEKTIVFDEVYPRRNAVAQAVEVDGSGHYKIIDRSIDFDVSEYLLEGITAKIAFTSGYMVGHEFEINYNHSERSIEILEQEINGYICPNEGMKPRVGDSYVLLDIRMPDSYIAKAQTELREKAISHIKENCAIGMEASLSIRPSWLFSTDTEVKAYQSVRVTDKDCGVDETLRITEVTYFPFDGDSYGKKTNVSVANFVLRSRLNLIDGKITETGRKSYTYYKTVKSQMTTSNIITNNYGDDLEWEFG